MKQIIKHLLYAGLIIVIFCIQSALGHRLMLHGAKPEILPYAVMTAAVFCGHASGAWLGALAGLLIDASSPTGLGIAMPVWFFIGAFGGVLTRKYLKKGFISAFLFGLAASAIQQLGTAVLFAGTGAPIGMTVKTAWNAILYSAVLSPVPYLIFFGIDRLMPSPEDYSYLPRTPVIRGFAHRRNGGDGV